MADHGVGPQKDFSRALRRHFEQGPNDGKQARLTKRASAKIALHLISCPTALRILFMQTPRVKMVICGEVAFPSSFQNGFFTGKIDGRIEIPDERPFIIHGINVHREPRPKITGRHGLFTIHAGRLLPSGSVAHLTYRER